MDCENLGEYLTSDWRYLWIESLGNGLGGSPETRRVEIVKDA